MEEFTVEVDGKNLTRDNIRTWLKAKKVTLWMDWILDDNGLDKATDWFMTSVKDCAASS